MSEVSQHFGTGAEVPEMSAISAPVQKCIADNSALVPKCPESEVSCVRSVCTPFEIAHAQFADLLSKSDLVLS